MLDELLVKSTHPEVLLKEAEITKQEALIKQTKALRLPVFSLSYQNARNWAGQEFFNLSSINNLSNQVFGANISIPIGNFSTKQKIKQSKLEFDINKMDLENTKLVKNKEDELLKMRLNQAERQLHQKENILRLQNSNDKHAENKYQKEIISLDERLNHYEDLLSSQDAYLQTLGTLTIAKYQLYIRTLNYQ
jgi:outer membrane protein TolC